MKEYYHYWHEATIAQLLVRGAMEKDADEEGDFYCLTANAWAESKRAIENVYRCKYIAKNYSLLNLLVAHICVFLYSWIQDCWG